MRTIRRITGALMLSALASAAAAADYSDPTWPCVQRKVETLSLGLMWPHQVDPAYRADDAALQRAVADLADLLSLRRIDLEELHPEVDSFAAAHGREAAVMGLVFQHSFDALSKRRSRIIAGIGDFSLGQIALAEKIDAARLAFDAALKADEPDYDRLDALEEQIDWDQIIYSDRQKSITYLCETPQLLERRLFAIAQMLSQAVE